MIDKNIIYHATGVNIYETNLFLNFEKLRKVLRSNSYDILFSLKSHLKFCAMTRSLFASREHKIIEENKLFDRLKMSNEVRNELAIIRLTADNITGNMSLRDIKKMVRKVGPDIFLIALVINWMTSPFEKIHENHPYATFIKLVHEWEVPKFPVSGDDLIAVGMKPGKEFGDEKKRLEELWEMSDYSLSKDQLLKMVEING